MKDNRLDYSSIIGLFLILFILTIFTYFNVNNNQEKKETIYISKKIIPSKKKKNNFFSLENNVLKLKISCIGGMISEVFLKKYKAYNNSFSSHSRDLYLVKNSSLEYNISFSKKKKKGININTNTLIFKPFSITNLKKIRIIVMRAKNPYGEGFLDFIYTIKKNQYDVGFYVRTKNFHSFNKSVFLNLEQKVFSLEKDRDWENSYTQVYYSTGSSPKPKKVKYLSEKNIENKGIPDINWIAHKQQFFSFIFIPEEILRNVFIRSENFSSGYFLKKIQFYTKIKNSKKNKEFYFSFRFYFGPLDFNSLKEYQSGFENIIPFGWGFLKWINKYFFLIIFQFLEKTNLNYGVIIILMTIVVKFILYPITYKQYKLSAIMKLIRPEIEEINKKYSNGSKDALKKQRAMMELYHKVGINPMSGCISTLFQIPIFYSLFKFFPTIINLRGKSFLWVEDLTSYDSILEFPFFIPFYGNHVSLLTLLYSLALLVYTRISNSENKDISKKETNSIPNMNFILYLTPIIMLLFINSYASALSLYYFTSNIINIGFLFFIKKFILDEQKILMKIQDKKLKKHSHWRTMIKKIINKKITESKT
ncbi:membrane protein insertase YidC [Blattabacterium cuenoti]|uniref:membrane protein insertase YidC n=1 Tax=Blattabacterium cuenoti TaxID=1653831 RepID=UPI00163BD0FE|nr:membrane protein insertase YidC [Blattabacterium cuenoti]